MSWMTFWTAFFVSSMGAYAVLVVVVSIRGFSDLRRLLAGREEEK